MKKKSMYGGVELGQLQVAKLGPNDLKAYSLQYKGDNQVTDEENIVLLILFFYRDTTDF